MERIKGGVQGRREEMGGENIRGHAGAKEGGNKTSGGGREMGVGKGQDIPESCLE